MSCRDGRLRHGQRERQRLGLIGPGGEPGREAESRSAWAAPGYGTTKCCRIASAPNLGITDGAVGPEETPDFVRSDGPVERCTSAPQPVGPRAWDLG